MCFHTFRHKLRKTQIIHNMKQTSLMVYVTASSLQLCFFTVSARSGFVSQIRLKLLRYQQVLAGGFSLQASPDGQGLTTGATSFY